MRKLVGVLSVMFVLGATTAALAIPAAAQTYPPTGCSLQLATASGAVAGGSVGVSGSGFTPGQNVPITANGVPVGEATASAGGTIATTIVIPANATSPVVIAAPGCQLSATLSAAAAKALAFTGSDSGPLVAAGLVAVALGSVLVFGARRRGATRATAETVRTGS